MASPPTNLKGARAQRPTKREPSCLEVSPSDSASFGFSIEIGLLILQENQEWSPVQSGSWKRLLTSVHECGDYLGFIEAADVLRAEVVKTGSWTTAMINVRSSRLRWMRGLVAALDHSFADPHQLVPSSPWFDALVTFLGWLKRLPIGIPSEEQSEDEYFMDDRRLSNVDVTDSPYLVGLREIWAEWFSGFSLPETFKPFHSSGSTADAGRVRTDKWAHTGVDVVSRVCLRAETLECPVPDFGGKTSRTSKLAFVPKSAGKRRSICMEPASLQFLQHGVAEALIAYTHDHSHPVSKLVNVHSQELNRELCGRAYSEGLATIDLSSASDSVSWQLIRELTFGLPLGRYLKATRSEWTRIRGYDVRMCKFAPMGSALCFPIECFVFASVVELAHRLTTGKTGTGFRFGSQVYGDDIIVPAELYQLVCEILTSIGFRVNSSKSFCGGNYFESCGVEYVQGWRIRTIRHPRRHLLLEGACHPERVDMVVDLANELLALGYLKARRFLLKYYLQQTVSLDQQPCVPLKLCVKWCEDGLKSINTPEVRAVYDPSLQRCIVPYIELRAVVSQGAHDFTQWSYDRPRRTREQRLQDMVTRYDLREPLSCFSVKAVTHLSKALPAYLYGGDVEIAGPIRTGRLRWKAYRTWYLPTKADSIRRVCIQPR